MDWKLEVVVVPVTDVDRAKDFYVGKVGFKLDADTQPTPALRVVHMTPPGSACSVVVGPTVVSEDADLGSGARYQLVVTDIETLDPRDGGKFAYFSDPDGNNWAVQEVRERVGAELG